MKVASISLALAISCGVASGGQEPSACSATFELIRERLSYMEDVAGYKTRHQIPIEDLERERTVVDAAKKRASEIGLDPDSVVDFYESQIAAAKAIQFRFRAEFLVDERSRPGTETDLIGTIRPALLDIGARLAESIRDCLVEEGGFDPDGFDDFDAAVQLEHLHRVDTQRIYRALTGVRLAKP